MTSLMFNRFGPLLFLPRATGPVLAFLLLALMAGASPAPAEQTETEDPHQEELAAEIIDLIRQDRRAEALPLCRSYNERFPGDRIMLYNQACMENLAGLPEDAVATFTKAVNAGFDDFAGASVDPDLAGLDQNPTMTRLVSEHRDRLAKLAASRAVSLAWKEESAPLVLANDSPGPVTGGPEIRLTWLPTGLGIELRAAPPWSSLVGPGNLAPWNGGSGLIFTLGVPDSNKAGEFQTSNHFVFAFGMEKNLPVGAAYLARPNRWQPISELQPKIRLDERDHLELRATIPWASILPYDPLVDALLGCNATVRLAGSGNQKTASIMSDPAAFRPRSATRRIIPLAFQTASIDEEVFIGKVSHTISGSEPVTIDLVAISLEGGSGLLSIDFLGGPDQSLLPEGQASQTIELSRGLNRLTRQADFSGLKTGAYVIKLGLTFPSGRTRSWGASILQTAPGWRTEFLTRIEQLNPQEKPTALFHLDTIEKAIAAHHQRRGPGAIVTTINELGRLLDNAESGGSILPDKGSFLAVYPGPAGETRLCHIYLPAGWKTAARLNPILMFTASPGLAGALADRMGQNYEQGRQKSILKAGADEGFPIYLVPRLESLDGRGPVDLTTESESSLAWALDSFGTATVSVAGSDLGAGIALQLATKRSAALKAIIVFAGRNLEPWPQADAEFITQQLAEFPGRLPVTWTDFVTETRIAGQSSLILQVLQDLGANIVAVEKVRGGLNYTQAADRTVLWAEGLR